MMIMSWLKYCLKPSDIYFKYRVKLAQLTDDYILVDLNAEHYVSLQDKFTQAFNLYSESDRSEIAEEQFGSDVMTLRLQALAFSVRTNSGKIPFDANKLDDLKSLIRLPESKLAEAYKVIANSSKLTGLFFEFLDETVTKNSEEKLNSNVDTIELDEPPSNP